MTQTAPKTGTFPTFVFNPRALVLLKRILVSHSLGALLYCEILFQSVPHAISCFGMHLAKVGNLFLHQ